ncbi:hypothetical protein Poli38472_012111 [Pythium oligandrum]|uniref:RRM domain-containing protein n=1 Tax=Pythium oligandrum TaxID=41045 RepID=A0A8K1CQR0_PYTOL|nr:hypothetical protein Poli38472_012111 [Pythium oligandrum]|eukprot:TMW66995.1 hypothetical protein Poli38472_012111 [Pythium oligandrum]
MAPPNVDAMITLKVDNVPFQVAPEELKELFTKYGEVGDVYIPRSRGSNESRGFAFIRFVNKEDAENAIAGMEGHDYQGRQLHVQYAKQRRPDNPREFYRERDRSRGYDDRGRGGGYDDRRGYDDRYRDARGYDDRGRGYDDRYREDRYDDRRGRYDERSHRRSRSPRDYRGGYGGRDRSRSRHRSRSPRRERRSASPPRRD